VVPADEVYERALSEARRLAAGASAAIALAKRAIDEGLDTTLSEGLDIEGRYFTDVYETDDAKTGVASFVENGPGKATFTGR
jgi:enoyl-CoA hydratase